MAQNLAFNKKNGFVQGPYTMEGMSLVLLTALQYITVCYPSQLRHNELPIKLSLVVKVRNGLINLLQVMLC